MNLRRSARSSGITPAGVESSTDLKDKLAPLNGAFLDFDLGSIESEELERDFEMALAVPPVRPAIECNCPYLSTCQAYCVPPP